MYCSQTPLFLLLRFSRARGFSSSYTCRINFQRPHPPALPPEQQREFDELQRTAQTPLNVDRAPEQHPDARSPLKAEFVGDTNPKTGEKGGPKREPVGKWGEKTNGDWSFQGRVTDF